MTSRTTRDPLTEGLGSGDVYLKTWTIVQSVLDGNGWRSVVAPGLVAAKAVGAGQVVACQLDPGALGEARVRVKALRLWNLLLADLGAEGTGTFLTAPGAAYEANEWEHIPPYMDW